jgi:hypothetical protein
VSSRPSGITLLAILLWLAGAAHILGALQEFGILPVVGGPGAGFYVADTPSGIVQVVAAVISLFVAGGLWGMQPWARKAVVLIAVANLAIVFYTKFSGGESWVNAIPGIAVNAAILLYARSPRVREALDA